MDISILLKDILELIKKFSLDEIKTFREQLSNGKFQNLSDDEYEFVRLIVDYLIEFLEKLTKQNSSDNQEQELDLSECIDTELKSNINPQNKFKWGNPMFKKLLIATLMLSPLTAYSKVSDKEVASYIEEVVRPIAKDAIGNKKITAVVNLKKDIKYINIKNGSCYDYDRLHMAIMNTSISNPDILDRETSIGLVGATVQGAAKLNCAFAKEYGY